MKYKFKWKRNSNFFWQSCTVIGHSYNPELDRMIIFYKKGLQEIAKWSECNLMLGKDYKEAVHAKMEQESGQKIPLKTVNE